MTPVVLVMMVVLLCFSLVGLILAGRSGRGDAILLAIAGVIVACGVLHNTVALYDQWMYHMQNPWLSNHPNWVFESWFYAAGAFLVASATVHYLGHVLFPDRKQAVSTGRQTPEEWHASSASTGS